MQDGFLAGVLDVTTTELADELVGGVLSAGPDRLEAAGAAGVPQVVSLGALDMVNFGPRETVPPQFEDRNLYVHNPTVTLMRTTPEECAELGRTIGRKLSAATGPTVLFVPLRRRVDDRRRRASRSTTPTRTRRSSPGCARRSATRSRCTSWTTDINDPAFADGDGRPPARADPARAMTRDEALARLRAQVERRQADHRRRRRHGALGEARRGGRRRPDHHLQQRPLPDGRPRLARRADAVRRRERDRRRHGARGAAGRARRRRCSPACAAPIRSG